jgi:hypothetical protein
MVVFSVAALALVVPTTDAWAQTSAVALCQTAVRDRIWQLRGDRSPVEFISANVTVASNRIQYVQGQGLVRAPGDVDRFTYNCTVDISRYVVTSVNTEGISSQVRPVIPATSDAVALCQTAVRERIWQLRRDRSPVEFISARVFVTSSRLQNVRGQGRVRAPGDVDLFNYECTVDVSRGIVTAVDTQGVARPGLPGFPANSRAVALCHDAVRNRIWQLRGDQSPVDFISSDVSAASARLQYVQGRGRVFAPGDVDYFTYNCTVDVARGFVTALDAQPARRFTDDFGFGPPGSVPGRFGGQFAANACHRVVRNRIWELRADRSPVHFTSTRLHISNKVMQDVRGNGYVRAPGDIDPFSYRCRVDARTGRVVQLRLQGRQHDEDRAFDER